MNKKIICIFLFAVTLIMGGCDVKTPKSAKEQSVTNWMWFFKMAVMVPI